MKNKIIRSVFIYIVAFCGIAQSVHSENEADRDFRYEADWESIRSKYVVPEWFKDAKFGIFIHWGPYCVPGISSEKYPRGIYSEGWRKNEGEKSPYNYHRRVYGDPSKFGYKDLIPMMTADKFDAKEWAKLFKDAGARYVVPVAEHHDAFAMYASKHTPWNALETGPKKDILGLLKEAVTDEGMKFGASSHFARHWVYYNHSDPTWDVNNPEYYSLYGKPHEKDALPSKEFLNLWWRRTTDIIDNYQPDLLWFDFGLDKPGYEVLHKKILSYYYNKGLDWDKELVFQDKNLCKTSRVDGKFYHDRSVKSFPEDLIVLDIERGRMNDIHPRPWQTDTSVGKKSWGYIHNEEYKSSDYLLDELIDIVSKNGCLLLNIGPKADGTIPDEAKAIMAEMGAWLKTNGEALYDTRPWKIYGEGPTKVSAGNHSEHENIDHVAADIRFTQKGDTLYAISLAWPKDGRINIKSLAKGSEHLTKSIKSVEFISGSNKMEWEQTNNGLSIKTVGAKPCEAAYVFKIKL